MDQFTLDLFYLADYSIAVTLPLPDAIETTYNFMSAVWLRGLNKIFEESGIDEAADINLQECAKTDKNPRQVIKCLENIDERAASAARKFTRIFHPHIIVNQIRIKEDENVGSAMVSAASRWLGFAPMLLGSIGWDDNVWLSLRRTKPLLIDFSGSRACKDLEDIVRSLMGLEYRDLMTPFVISPDSEEQNYYELLEIYPGASEEEVRRAFKQIKLWFGIEGIACRGVCTDKEREKFQLMAEKAHAQLVDRSKRREYDRIHFPEGFSSMLNIDEHRQKSIAGTVAVTQASLPRVELSDDQFVDGAFLGKIRKERNIDLVDISNRAKISVRYLQAIEEERFDELPAAVFTRGFVTEFARFLKVDPVRAASDFMAVYNSYFDKK
jgi:flagellar biosynthesis protein FlhG